jgi:hypothetical protein
VTGSPAQGDGARFRYLAKPALSALSSRAGAASGGTVAAVCGRAFVDDDKESDRGVVPACFVSSAELECIVPRASCGRPGAVALAVSLNGGADFDGGDSSSVPGARRARVRVHREHRCVVARAARRPDERHRAPRLRRGFALSPELSCLFGGTASGGTASGDAAAATVVGASYSVFSCARALGGGDDAAHAGARALELCTCGTSLNLMCCFMGVGEFGMARGRAQSTQSNL